MELLSRRLEQEPGRRGPAREREASSRRLRPPYTWQSSSWLEQPVDGGSEGGGRRQAGAASHAWSENWPRGGKLGLTQVRCRFFSLPTLVLPPTVLHLEETLKDARLSLIDRVQKKVRGLQLCTGNTLSTVCLQDSCTVHTTAL